MIPETGTMSKLWIHLGDHDKTQTGNTELKLKVEYLVFRPDRYYESPGSWKNMAFDETSADLGTWLIM